MWDSEMVTLLRYVIDDVETPTKYSDDRLAKLVLVAATFVKNENRFDDDYAINVENGTLKPDPTSYSAGTRNEAFVNLTILKAACLLASGGLGIGKSHANVSWKEGPYQYSKTGRLDDKKFNVETWCGKYEKERIEYGFNSNLVPGLAIIGPYKSCISRGDCRDGRVF